MPIRLVLLVAFVAACASAPSTSADGGGSGSDAGTRLADGGTAGNAGSDAGSTDPGADAGPTFPIACSSNADCPEGQVCPATLGFCNPHVSGGTTWCGVDADCLGGQYCDPEFGQCLDGCQKTGCLSHETCGADQRCGPESVPLRAGVQPVLLDSGLDSEPAMAPDEQHVLAFRSTSNEDCREGSATQGDLVVGPTTGGTQAWPVLAHGVWTNGVAFSPDGASLVYVDAATTGCSWTGTLHVAAADGTNARTVDSNVAEIRLVGGTLFYGKQVTTGAEDLYAVPLAGGTPVRLGSLAGSLADVRPSPDGLHVAFVDATRAQVLAHVSGAAPTVLSDGVGQKVYPSLALPVWSPHSDRLAWCFGGSDIAQPRTLTVSAADGSGAEVLSSDMVCGALAFAPDGGRLAYDVWNHRVDTVDIVVHAFGGGADAVTSLVPGTDCPTADPFDCGGEGEVLAHVGTWGELAFSRDGRHLITDNNIVAADPESILAVGPAAGGTFTSVLTGFDSIVPGDWRESPLGGYLTFHTYDTPGGLDFVGGVVALDRTAGATFAGSPFVPRAEPAVTPRVLNLDNLTHTLSSLDLSGKGTALPGGVDTIGEWVGTRAVYETRNFDLVVANDDGSDAGAVGRSVIAWDFARTNPAPTRLVFAHSTRTEYGLYLVTLP